MSVDETSVRRPVRAWRRSLVALAILLGAMAPQARAETSGTWKGTIRKSVKDSKPHAVEFAKKAPEGAPNIIWILLDDVGYGATSAFGGLANTPTLEKLASRGLRYTNFH